MHVMGCLKTYLGVSVCAAFALVALASTTSEALAQSSPDIIGDWTALTIDVVEGPDQQFKHEDVYDDSHFIVKTMEGMAFSGSVDSKIDRSAAAGGESTGFSEEFSLPIVGVFTSPNSFMFRSQTDLIGVGTLEGDVIIVSFLSGDHAFSAGRLVLKRTAN